MIKKVKGLDVLLKAFQDIVLEFPEIILLVAGKPWHDKFDEYQYLIDEYNLTNNVILHTKFISENQVSLYYSSCDLVVLPYTKIYQSGVLMMALSYERPVLVSDLSPLEELITNNVNGFTFQTENSADLSKRLKKILFDKENLDRVTKNGVELISSKYNWNKIGRLSKKMYQDL
jgi:glycosyltransferase involved in cell wall biosynthesis